MRVSGSNGSPGQPLDGLAGELLEELVGDRLLQQQARAGAAHLARVAEDALGGLGHGAVDVRHVGEDDVRRLPAALELDALHVRLPGVDEEELADLARARERDLVDVHVAADRLARGLAHPREDVHHAVGDARLGGELGQRERHDRRLLGGLEDDGVARGQRRRELPRRHQDRVVPRHDHADHADRLARDQADHARPGRPDLAVDLVDGLGEVAEAGHGAADLALGVADRLAHVDGDHRRELVAVALDQVGEAEQDGAALARREARPRARLERAARGGDGAVDVLGVAGGDVEDGLARHGADARERRAGGGVDEGAVDEGAAAEAARVGERAAPWGGGGHAPHYGW